MEKYEKKIFEFISDLLSIPIEELIEDQKSFGISSPESWDSLAHLAIMTELEELLGRELSIDDIEKLDNLQKITEFLRR